MISGRPESRSGVHLPPQGMVAGRFTIQQPLGLSSGSLCYRGADLQNASPVFLRAIDTRGMPPGTVARLEQEAAVLARIDSPYVVPLIYRGYDRETLWLAFEFAGQNSLRRRLDGGRLPLAQALPIFRGLTAGLADLHRHGLLHRAIRPDSVFLPTNGPELSIRIGGFDSRDATDLLRAEGAASRRLTEVANYLPPEQTGVIEEPLSESSNVYSAGCILFECLCGHVPFAAEALTDLLHQQATRPVPRIRELGVPVPRIVDDILQRCLARDSRSRYQSMEALGADLDTLAEALGRGDADPDMTVGARDYRGVLVEPALVARKAELHQLGSAFQQTVAGEGEVTFVEAPSGFGKSRLLSEFAAQAVQAGGDRVPRPGDHRREPPAARDAGGGRCRRRQRGGVPSGVGGEGPPPARSGNGDPVIRAAGSDVVPDTRRNAVR